MSPTRPVSEAALWRAFKSFGDEKARQQLLTNYYHLCRITAANYRWLSSDIELDDLANEGFLGLCTAVDKFDTARKITFRTFAIRYIRYAIKEYFRNDDWVTQYEKKRLKKLADFERRFKIVNKREATEAEMLAFMKITQFELNRLLELRGGNYPEFISLNAPVSIHESIFEIEDELIEVLKASASTSDETEIAIRDEVIFETLSGLPEKERFVIGRRYWLGETFVEIGRKMQVSEWGVKRIHDAGINTLKAQIKSTLKGYY